ncbi:hypothetical protein SAMN04488118_11569 [Epibacterium ulvae]|uniref:Uncharacterized protein n=1 Tax=Epibacterium ulvae TaxID=1156985 RepID=A0A1G5RFS6_9RHOB|nr:hypothetical protein SAMN04488118_11569 [Epibacterium ulvae]
MESLAQNLGVSCVTANVFRHVGSDHNNSPLVIDAFDELAKVDTQGIHKLLATARKAQPTRIIISSRSLALNERTCFQTANQPRRTLSTTSLGK